MKKLLVTFLWFSVQLLVGQNSRVTAFYPLTPIDTIYSTKAPAIAQRIDSLPGNTYFFTYKDAKYKSGLLLTKKVENSWIVYEFTSELLNASNTQINTIHQENNSLLSIQLSRFPSGTCANTYTFLVVLNIKTCKTIEFCTYHHQECYNESGEIYAITECSATVQINGNIIKVKGNKNTADGLNCTESAEYEIKNDNLIKH